MALITPDHEWNDHWPIELLLDGLALLSGVTDMNQQVCTCRLMSAVSEILNYVKVTSTVT